MEVFEKAKPLTFDGEIKKVEEIEAWPLGIEKYFRIHNYFENMKVKFHHLQPKGQGQYLMGGFAECEGYQREGFFLGKV